MIPSPTNERLAAYLQLIRFDRPIGTLLLLWPTLWGLWIASAGKPDPTVLVVFVVGTFLMRSAGCAINDYADRNFDAHVARTQHRPLARGVIAPREALWVAAVLAGVALVMSIAFLNAAALALCVPAAFLAASYPFTKRFLAIPQAYLGVAFGFGIPMAFAAQTNAVPTQAWLLLGASALWTIAYDTEYAMVDRADDLKLGLHTSAIFFGRYDVLAVMLCYAAALSLLAYVGVGTGLRWPFWLGLACAGAVSLYHYTLIRERDRTKCFQAFLHNNWWGAVVFLGIAGSYVA